MPLNAPANPDSTNPSIPGTPPPESRQAGGQVSGGDPGTASTGGSSPMASPASQAPDASTTGAAATDRTAADSSSSTSPTVAPPTFDPPTFDPPTFDPMANGPQPPALEPRLTAVANIADPHLRQHVEANVRLQTQRQIAAFTDAQRQAKAQAKQVIDQGGDLSTIPARLMLQIDTPGRLALRDYAMAHGSPATDPVTYYGLKNQALDDPGGFQAVDIANHMARLKPSDYADLQQLQTSLRNNQPPADLPLQQAYKANTDRMLQGMGLPTSVAMPGDDTAGSDAADPQAQQQALQFRQSADLQLAANQAATGRQLTPAEHRNLLSEVSSQQPQASTSSQQPAAALAGTTMAADAIGSGVQGIDTEAAAALGRALLSKIAPFGPAAAFVAEMWPKPTASPALDEALPVHDVPDPENGVARSEDSDGPVGAQINESKKDFRRKRDQAKAPKVATAGASAPPPGQEGPDGDQDEEPVFKKPSRNLKPGDRIDLNRFKIKVGKGAGQFLRDPKTGYTIQKDVAEHGWEKPPRAWKLRDQFGKLVGSLDETGKYLADKQGF